MKNVKDIKNEIVEENEKVNKLEDRATDEIKKYKDDILKKDVDFCDEKPLLQKIVFLLDGVTNLFLGYSLYFILKDDKKRSWQASYLGKGATIGLVLGLIGAVVEIVQLVVDKM